MKLRLYRPAATAAALALSLGLAACGTGGASPVNTSVNSVRQPVVERNNFMLDLASSPNGLSAPEQRRLADWFETLDLGYGDRIAIDDAIASAAVREDVAALAGRYGLLLADGAPITQGHVGPGQVRVVVTRSTAHVPGCPNWNGQNRTSLANGVSEGYGCAINGNLAAMVADPEHLLEGASGTGETVVMTSNRAIDSYRGQTPTGAGGLAAAAGGGGGN